MIETFSNSDWAQPKFWGHHSSLLESRERTDRSRTHFGPDDSLALPQNAVQCCELSEIFVSELPLD